MNKIYYSLFFSLFFLVSRGLFQIFVSKSMAYMLAFFGCVLFLIIFYYKIKVIFSLKKERVLLSGLFFAFALVSYLSMLLSGYNEAYGIYIVYPFVISVVFFYSYSIFPRANSLDKKKFRTTIGLFIWTMFVVATAEQLHIFSMPGETFTFLIFIRPSSMTGSYLHYPLVMVLLATIIYTLDNKLTITSMVGYLELVMIKQET